MMKKRENQRPVGSTLRLRCNAQGNPVPSIRWFRDATQIAYFGEENAERKHSTLKLTNMKENESGDYKCMAENIHGHINFTYSVEVIGKHSHFTQVSLHITGNGCQLILGTCPALFPCNG